MINYNNIFCCNKNLQNCPNEQFKECNICQNLIYDSLFKKESYLNVDYNIYSFYYQQVFKKQSFIKKDDLFYIIKNNSLFLNKKENNKRIIIFNNISPEDAINCSLKLLNDPGNLIFL